MNPTNKISQFSPIPLTPTESTDPIASPLNPIMQATILEADQQASCSAICLSERVGLRTNEEFVQDDRRTSDIETELEELKQATKKLKAELARRKEITDRVASIQAKKAFFTLSAELHAQIFEHLSLTDLHNLIKSQLIEDVEENKNSLQQLKCAVLRKLGLDPAEEYDFTKMMMDSIHCPENKEWCNIPNEAVELLIFLGANPNAKIKGRYEDSFPLVLAIERDSVADMKVLINARADINLVYDNYNYTLLHTAVFRKNIEAIHLLLDYKLSIDSQDSTGCTPLHYVSDASSSSRHYSVKLQKLLIRLGANTKIPNNKGIKSEDLLKSKQVVLK